MNELRFILVGLAGLVFSAFVFWFTDMPPEIEDKDMDIIIALSVGLLILIIDKRQERHLHEISNQQHKMISDIHDIVKVQMDMIAELHQLHVKHNKNANDSN